MALSTKINLLESCNGAPPEQAAQTTGDLAGTAVGPCVRFAVPGLRLQLEEDLAWIPAPSKEQGGTRVAPPESLH